MGILLQGEILSAATHTTCRGFFSLFALPSTPQGCFYRTVWTLNDNKIICQICRLPVGFAAQAHLGSLVAQAVLGDYQPIENYASHLNNAKIAQLKDEQLPFIEHVRELHKNHRFYFREYF